MGVIKNAKLKLDGFVLDFHHLAANSVQMDFQTLKKLVMWGTILIQDALIVSKQLDIHVLVILSLVLLSVETLKLLEQSNVTTGILLIMMDAHQLVSRKQVGSVIQCLVNLLVETVWLLDKNLVMVHYLGVLTAKLLQDMNVRVMYVDSFVQTQEQIKMNNVMMGILQMMMDVVLLVNQNQVGHAQVKIAQQLVETEFQSLRKKVVMIIILPMMMDVRLYV